jgi:hypothetical protein
VRDEVISLAQTGRVRADSQAWATSATPRPTNSNLGREAEALFGICSDNFLVEFSRRKTCAECV